MTKNRAYLTGAVMAAALLATATGCGPQAKDTRKPGSAKAHDHPDLGPNKGALAEWGDEEYHAEFTVDHDKKAATVYILDGSAKKAAPIKAKEIALTIRKPAFSVTLKAAPEKGDPEGTASRFVGTHEAFGKEQEFAGTISGEVDGKPYSGDFEEKAHAGHKLD